MHKRKLIFFTILLIASFSLFTSGCTSPAKKPVNPLAPSADDGIRTPSPKNQSDNSSSEVTLKPAVHIVTELSAIEAGTEVELIADAIDPAGGAVKVYWEASMGEIRDTWGSSALWATPMKSGEAEIKCTAVDARGEKSEALLKVKVIANRTYKVTVLSEKRSMITSTVYNDNDPYIPASNVKVEIPAVGKIAVTNTEGIAEINVPSDYLQQEAEVIVSFGNRKITYDAKLHKSDFRQTEDEVILSPSYDFLDVAMAKGDSFILPDAQIYVKALETIGAIEAPLKEVKVESPMDKAFTDMDAKASLMGGLNDGATPLNFYKLGYEEVRNCSVPIKYGSVTLVTAKMIPLGSYSHSEAVISSLKPFNGQQKIPVTTSFEITFAQPMDSSRLFESFSLTVENKTLNKKTIITQANIAEHFTVIEKPNNTFIITPVKKLFPDSVYSLFLQEWTARAFDGRLLKDYSGLYREFKTDSDPMPRLVEQGPAAGSEGVSVFGPLYMVFDRAMDPASFISKDLSFELINLETGHSDQFNSDNVEGFFRVAWNKDATKLTLVPIIAFSRHSNYQLRIKKIDLKSASGQPMESIEHFWTHFKTGGM